MLKVEFSVLTELQKSYGTQTQRDLAKSLAFSLGKVNYVLKNLRKKRFHL